MPAKAILPTLGLLAVNPTVALVRHQGDLSSWQQNDIASHENGPIEWVQSLVGGGGHAEQEMAEAEDEVALQDTCNDTKRDTDGVASLRLSAIHKGDELRVSSGEHIGKEVQADTFLQAENLWRVNTTDGERIKVKPFNLQKKIFETRIGPDGKAHTKAQFEKASWHDEWKKAEKSQERRYNAAGQAWIEERFVKHYGDCAWKKWNQAPSVEPTEPKLASSLLQETAEQTESGPIEWVQSLVGGGGHAEQEIAEAEEEVALQDTCNDTKRDTDGVASLRLSAIHKGDELRVSSGEHIGKEVQADTFLQAENLWRVNTTDGERIKVKPFNLQKKIFETRIGPDGKAHTKAQFEKASWHDEWKKAEKSQERRYNAAGQAWIEERFVKHYGDCAWKKWNQAPSVEPAEPRGQMNASLLQHAAEQTESGPIEWVQSLVAGGVHADIDEVADSCNDTKTDTKGVASLRISAIHPRDQLRVSGGDHIGKDVRAETFLRGENMWRVVTPDGKKIKIEPYSLQKRMHEMRVGPDGKPHTKDQFEKASWHDEWKEAEKLPERRYNAAGKAWTKDRFEKHYTDCAWKKWNEAPSVEPAEPAEPAL